ncbi:hypothetical protein AAC387_Pa06g1040 [Persea americana]
MPALQMKAKPNVGCLREGSSLHAGHHSTKISKRSGFQVKISKQAAMLDTSVQSHEDVASVVEVCGQDSECSEDMEHRDLLTGAAVHIQKTTVPSFDSSLVDRLGSLQPTCPSILETIFSPIFEPNDAHCNPLDHDIAGIPVVSHQQPRLDGASDDSDDGSCSSSDYQQSCNVSDFHISDMSVASLPFDEDEGLHDIITANTCPESPDYECTDPDMMIDVADRYMILPFLDDTVETRKVQDRESVEEVTMNSDDSCLYLAIHQMQPSDQETISAHCENPDEADGFDPHLFIKNLPDLSEVVPSQQPLLLPKETRKRKPVTLVLDLDETLVHSTLEHCDDADFTFSVYFNMKENTVYVRQRPYLDVFLKRVAEMFEVIVFTASQSIYAEQLLNILDPDRKFISQRVYRESCVFSDGAYTKDLTVLGLDLAKVAIVDNSPQVYRLQVNNGIPIRSWFDDPSDCALISLLPFLETLVNADDVRPIIAKQFGNKE